MLTERKNLRIYNPGTDKMLSTPITVLHVASRLSDHGVCSPKANAEAILSHLLGSKAIDLYTNTLMLSPADSKLLEQMINRRINGEPLQYITGRTNFYGNDIAVREGVFIPRPETEILVDTVIEYVKSSQYSIPNFALPAGRPQPLILDLCTGSGNIAISLTKSLTHCKIISSDISETALEAAQENVKRNEVSDRIVFIKSDFLSLPCEYKRAFDIIVCNPPYIRYCDMKNLSHEVKYEPVKALCGGVDGMDFYRRIVKDSPEFLKVNGLIALEIPDNSRLEVENIINDSGSFSNIKFFNDLNNIERVAIARSKG